MLGRTVRSRVLRAATAAVVLLGVLLGATACEARVGETGRHYEIAGGSTTGVYYAYGASLAGALERELGLDIAVAETEGSVDNLMRVGSGRALFGFAQGDAAGDAASGRRGFDEPLPIRAVARVYDEYVHVVVPADSEVRGIEDLAGRIISLGAENSGVQVIAARVLEAAGVDPAAVRNPALGLHESVEAMRRGEIEGFFWVGGLPTPGIEQLERAVPIRLLPIGADVIERVNAVHDGVYQMADFPLGVYGAGETVVTMTVPNYLVTAESTDDEVVSSTLRVLFDTRAEIARDVPAAELLDLRQAIFTSPIELHPGAARYYVAQRR